MRDWQQGKGYKCLYCNRQAIKFQIMSIQYGIFPGRFWPTCGKCRWWPDVPTTEATEEKEVELILLGYTRRRPPTTEGVRK